MRKTEFLQGHFSCEGNEVVKERNYNALYSIIHKVGVYRQQL